MNWLVFGAGAQGRITVELLAAAAPGAGRILLDDDPVRRGTRVQGVEVHGRDWLAGNLDPGCDLGVVALGRNPTRLAVAAELSASGLRFGVVRHPSAVVLESASLGEGTVVFPGAVVQSQARVGPHGLINTGAIVEHDCVLEEGVSVSPGARMAGRVTIGAGAFLGVGAVLAPRVKVGAGSIVGAGSVVVADLPPGVLAYGVPARVIRPVDPERDWPRLL